MLVQMAPTQGSTVLIRSAAVKGIWYGPGIKMQSAMAVGGIAAKIWYSQSQSGVQGASESIVEDASTYTEFPT